jgi:hypothetical protein
MELIIGVGFTNGSVSIKCESFEEAEAARQWLIKQQIIDAPKPAEDAPEPAPEPAPAAPAPAAKKSTAKREAVQKAEAVPEVTIQDVTKAVTDYAAKLGPTEARALFARFGVTRGGDLKPEQFADFVSTALDYTARGIKASEAQPETSESLM